MRNKPKLIVRLFFWDSTSKREDVFQEWHRQTGYEEQHFYEYDGDVEMCGLGIKVNGWFWLIKKKRATNIRGLVKPYLLASRRASGCGTPG